MTGGGAGAGAGGVPPAAAPHGPGRRLPSRPPLRSRRCASARPSSTHCSRGSTPMKRPSAKTGRMPRPTTSTIPRDRPSRASGSASRPCAGRRRPSERRLKRLSPASPTGRTASAPCAGGRSRPSALKCARWRRRAWRAPRGARAEAACAAPGRRGRQRAGQAVCPAARAGQRVSARGSSPRLRGQAGRRRAGRRRAERARADPRHPPAHARGRRRAGGARGRTACVRWA